MRSQRLSPFMALRDSPLQLVVACVVGLLLGVACVLSSPVWVLGALTAGLIVVAAFERPEIALLGILALTSSIVFESSLPLIPVGFGSLHIPDIILLALLSLIAVRRLAEPDFAIIRTPLDWPLLAFFAVALLATFVAILQGSLDAVTARRAIRTATYYLTFFVVTNLVREKGQLRLLLRGISLLAVIVAVAMVAQFLLGASLSFLPGRVEGLSAGHSGVTRVLPPGQSIILVSFIVTSVLLALRRFKLIPVPMLLQWGLVGLAVVLTFNRSFWVAVLLALFLLFLLTRGFDRARLLGLILIALTLSVLVLLSALMVSESQTVAFVRAAFDRFATLFSPETTYESSLQWRYVENEYAFAQIAAHPVLGLGLGAQYRPFDSRIDRFGQGWDARVYIHNAHLWIMLNTGLPGYICLIWLSLAFLVRGFRHWREIWDAEMRATVLGFTLTYLGIQFTAIVNPIFMQWFWVPVLAIMMGVNEAIFSMDRERASFAPTTGSLE